MLLLDFKVQRSLLRHHVLSFKIPADSLKTLHLEEDHLLEHDSEFYYISKKVQSRKANQLFYEIEANATWYRLGERQYHGSYGMVAVTPGEGLQAILNTAFADDLNWGVGELSPSTSLYSMEATNASYLDLIYQWAKICGCEVTFDTFSQTVTMVEQVGGQFGLSFRYTRNLTEIAREVIPPAVTKFYPEGRDKLTIASVNGGVEYIEDYSFYTNQGIDLPTAKQMYRKDFHLADTSFVDATSLYQWAVNKMAVLSQAMITYSAKVVDLSIITGFDETSYSLGDTAVVEDEPLGISVEARILSITRYPYEPHKDEIELGFVPISLPDPNIQSSSTPNERWLLLTRVNTDTPRTVSVGRTVLHRLPIEVSQQGQWIKTYNVSGTCISAGTLQITITDDNSDVEGNEFLPTILIPLETGETFERTLTVGDKEIETGTYQFTIRAEMIDTGEVLLPSNESSFWIWALGAREGSNPEYDTSIRFDSTSGFDNPHVWRVPDDVSELFVQVYGCGPYGGYMGGKIDVIAGDYYEIWVGGTYSVVGGSHGFYNQGNSVDGYGNDTAAGSSSHIVKQGNTFAQALLVAGGGGAGANGTYGGGGYPNGLDGLGGAGTGGSQTAGGIGTGGGVDGAFNDGGDGKNEGSFFGSRGNPGGGGWYGGGGSGVGSIGGGGSGHAHPSVWDLEYENNMNNYTNTSFGGNIHNGYVIISWMDPPVPD